MVCEEETLKIEFLLRKDTVNKALLEATDIFVPGYKHVGFEVTMEEMHLTRYQRSVREWLPKAEYESQHHDPSKNGYYPTPEKVAGADGYSTFLQSPNAVRIIDEAATQKQIFVISCYTVDPKRKHVLRSAPTDFLDCSRGASNLETPYEVSRE